MSEDGICEICGKVDASEEMLPVPFVGTGWICRCCDGRFKRTKYKKDKRVNSRLAAFERKLIGGVCTGFGLVIGSMKVGIELADGTTVNNFVNLDKFLKTKR